MSVLIRGMEMPKAGNWKTIRVYYDGTCAEPNWQGDCKVMKGCDAVPIPDHGDLIDKNELLKKAEFIGDAFTGRGGYVVWGDDILNAQTVIPAERSEDGET